MSPERDIEQVSNFQIAMEMPASDYLLMDSVWFIRGQVLRLAKFLAPLVV